MTESRRRTRSRKVPSKDQARPELADDEVVRSSAQVSDATADPPAAEVEVSDQPQPPAPEDEPGVNVDIEITTNPVKKGKAGDSSVKESSDPVADLFQRREFVEQVANAMVANGKAADSLMGDLSDKLQDHIEDDPEFRRNLITRAMASPSFRDKVVKALAKAME